MFDLDHHNYVDLYCHIVAKIIPFTAPCPTLNDPSFGSVMTHYNLTIDLFIAEYTCIDDFTIVGDSHRFCLDNGKWSGREPYCVAGMYVCV